MSYPDIEEGSFLKVKLLQGDGSDWFAIPNNRVKEFYEYLVKFEVEEYPTRLLDEQTFEKKFAHFRTEGDINNIQFYRSIKDIITDVLSDKKL